MRLAIGAGRGRLVRQTLTEALVLVGVSAALGIALAEWGTRALGAAFAEGSRPIVIDLSLSGRMLLFTLLVSVLTGFGFGVLPAFRAAHVEPQPDSVTAHARWLAAGGRCGLAAAS